MNKRNKMILIDLILLVGVLGILFLYIADPFNPNGNNPSCENCFPASLIGLYVGVLICVIRGVDDPLVKPQSKAEASHKSFKSSMLSGSFMFFYLAVSYLATPQFERLFAIGILAAVTLFFLFHLLLHLHYRREVKIGGQDVQKSVAWLEALSTRNEEIDNE